MSRLYTVKFITFFVQYMFFNFCISIEFDFLVALFYTTTLDICIIYNRVVVKFAQGTKL